MTPIYSGKSKNFYGGGAPGLLRMEFRDDATAFNGEKKDTIQGKGAINAAVSAVLMKQFASEGIRTHLFAVEGPIVHLVHDVDILPVEFIVRNKAAGSFCKRFNTPKGQVFPKPIFELTVKDDSLGDPPINNETAIALGRIDQKQLDFIRNASLRINQIMRRIFSKANLDLVDFKLEFGTAKKSVHGTHPLGRYHARAGEILLADEISPDSMRVWDAQGNSLDKDIFRHELGDLLPGYKQILKGVQA